MPNDSQIAPNNLSGKKFFDSNQLPGNDEVAQVPICLTRTMTRLRALWCLGRLCLVFRSKVLCIKYVSRSRSCACPVSHSVYGCGVQVGPGCDSSSRDWKSYVLIRYLIPVKLPPAWSCTELCRDVSVRTLLRQQWSRRPRTSMCWVRARTRSTGAT